MSLLEIARGKSGPWALPSRRSAMRHRDEESLLIVNGHPDPRPERFCAALCQAWLDGALAAGRDADVLTLGAIFSASQETGSEGMQAAVDRFRRPTRMTVIFPLWLDKPPEIVTRFFEQVQRAGDIRTRNHRAHVVATMSLPAFAHRSMLQVSIPGLEIDALNFIGSVDTISQAQRQEWLYRLRRLGSGNC